MISLLQAASECVFMELWRLAKWPTFEIWGESENKRKGFGKMNGSRCFLTVLPFGSDPKKSSIKALSAVATQVLDGFRQGWTPSVAKPASSIGNSHFFLNAVSFKFHVDIFFYERTRGFRLTIFTSAALARPREREIGFRLLFSRLQE